MGTLNGIFAIQQHITWEKNGEILKLCGAITKDSTLALSQYQKEKSETKRRLKETVAEIFPNVLTQTYRFQKLRKSQTRQTQRNPCQYAS